MYKRQIKKWNLFKHLKFSEIAAILSAMNEVGANEVEIRRHRRDRAWLERRLRLAGKKPKAGVSKVPSFVKIVIPVPKQLGTIDGFDDELASIREYVKWVFDRSLSQPDKENHQRVISKPNQGEFLCNWLKGCSLLQSSGVECQEGWRLIHLAFEAIEEVLGWTSPMFFLKYLRTMADILVRFPVSLVICNRMKGQMHLMCTVILKNHPFTRAMNLLSTLIVGERQSHDRSKAMEMLTGAMMGDLEKHMSPTSSVFVQVEVDRQRLLIYISPNRDEAIKTGVAKLKQMLGRAKSSNSASDEAPVTVAIQNHIAEFLGLSDSANNLHKAIKLVRSLLNSKPAHQNAMCRWGLLYTAADLEQNLKNLGAKEVWLREALELTRDQFGENSPQHCRGLSDLKDFYNSCGKYFEAEQLHEKELWILAQRQKK
jgi:hypothetical protein